MLPLLLLLPIQGSATPPQDEVELPETVVVAPRSQSTVTTTKAKTTVVTGEELVETGARSLPRAIGEATGVWIQETSQGGGAPVVRGLLGNKVLILIDGVRLNDGTTRYGPNQSLNTIDPSIVDRVEVIHGSSSVLYGSDALGGVIAIWTKQRLPQDRDPEGDARPLRGEVSGRYVSASDGGRGSVLGSWANDRMGILGNWGGWRWGDTTAGDNTEQPFTGYEGNGIFGSWNLALGPKRMLRTTARINRDFDVPRTDKLVAGYGQTAPTHEIWDYTLQDRRGYTVFYDDANATSWFDGMQLRLSLRTYEEHRKQLKVDRTVYAYERDDIQTFGVGADWRKTIGENHVLTYGLDLDHDDVDSDRRDTDIDTGATTWGDGSFAPNARYTQAGVFVQDELLGLAPYYLTLGLRYSWFTFDFDEVGTGVNESGDFDALTASVELAREMPEDFFVVATLAQGFRAPNLNDLAQDGNFAGGELHNPDLVPEKSLTAELSTEVNKPRWSAAATVFGTYIDDYIGRSSIDEGNPGETGDEIYQRSNSGYARMWGVELIANAMLIPKREDWKIGASAAWVRGREYGEAPLDGVEMRRIPPLNGRVWLRNEPDALWEHLGFAELSVVWAARQDELHPEDQTDPRMNPTGTPGWATLNIDVGGAIDTWSHWRLGVHNLLDQHYRVHASGVDAPGISLVAEVTLGF